MSGQKTPGRSKKDMNTPLLLTALVDAFSILVIFLLVQISGAPNTFEANDAIKLPTASTIEAAQADFESQIANLVVTKGDLFQEKTEIKYVFIDGKKIEPVAEAPAPTGEVSQ